jgi:hypothetical protein
VLLHCEFIFSVCQNRINDKKEEERKEALKVEIRNLECSLRKSYALFTVFFFANGIFFWNKSNLVNKYKREVKLVFNPGLESLLNALTAFFNIKKARFKVKKL